MGESSNDLVVLLRTNLALQEEIELRKQDEQALAHRVEELEREVLLLRRHANQLARGPKSIGLT